MQSDSSEIDPEIFEGLAKITSLKLSNDDSKRRITELRTKLKTLWTDLCARWNVTEHDLLRFDSLGTVDQINDMFFQAEIVLGHPVNVSKLRSALKELHETKWNMDYIIRHYELDREKLERAMTTSLRENRIFTSRQHNEVFFVNLSREDDRMKWKDFLQLNSVKTLEYLIGKNRVVGLNKGSDLHWNYFLSPYWLSHFDKLIQSHEPGTALLDREYGMPTLQKMELGRLVDLYNSAQCLFLKIQSKCFLELAKRYRQHIHINDMTLADLVEHGRLDIFHKGLNRLFMTRVYREEFLKRAFSYITEERTLWSTEDFHPAYARRFPEFRTMLHEKTKWYWCNEVLRPMWRKVSNMMEKDMAGFDAEKLKLRNQKILLLLFDYIKNSQNPKGWLPLVEWQRQNILVAWQRQDNENEREWVSRYSVQKIAGCKNRSYVLTTSGQVRMFTSIEPSKTIWMQKTFWTPAGTEYTDVSPGEKHVLLLTNSGDVYVIYHDVSPARPPFRIPGIPEIQGEIQQISTGSYHSLILTESGEVYSFGSGLFGQLGHGDIGHLLLPKLVEAMRGKKVVQVSAGRLHSLVLTESGEVYSFGDGFQGQLGHGDNKRQTLPKLIEAMRGKKVVQVSAGTYHSLVLTESGEVYSFGDGLQGQLGHGDTDNQTLPKLIEAMQDKEVAQISAGFLHSLLLTENHEVYSFGHGESGNLGHGDAKCQTLPKLIEAMQDKNVKQICAYEHSLLLTETGFSARERAGYRVQLYGYGPDPALNFNVFLFGMQRGTVAEPLSISFFIALLDISDNITDVLRPRSFERPLLRIELAPDDSDGIPPPVAVRPSFEQSGPSAASATQEALNLETLLSQRYLRYTDCRSFAHPRARLRF